MLATPFTPLRGGLDLVTPPIELPAGKATTLTNYECGQRGYRRCAGFERYDGQPAPSEASYWVLEFDAGTATITEGQTVTGLSSSATGKALVAMTVLSGSFGGSNAAGFLVLTNVTGTFTDNEALQVGGVTKCTADGTATENGASNDTDDMTWRQDAIETARDLIAAVPGSGPVRGVWRYGGNVYAFRNDAGGTAGIMHKATAAGWSAVALGKRVAFTSGGTYEIVEGNTITGATSGATAVITRVVVTSGDWTTGNAAGYLIFASQTGTFQAENLNVGANLNVATIAGNSANITIPAGGRYEFRNHNFYGASDLNRMYGVNGVGQAFEFDGTVFVPIVTGMTVDTPNHIAVHKNQLFLGFPGGSIQNSALGNPYSWQPILGAAEIALGQDCVGMQEDIAGGLLAIFGRSKVAVLYGNDSDDFSLVGQTDVTGAFEWTLQQMASPMYYSDLGLLDLARTQAFGNFKAGTLSRFIWPLLEAKRDAGILPVASLRVREKDQYRLFFSDGSGVIVYLGMKFPEFSTFDLGFAVACTASCICLQDDREYLYMGDADGMVYRLDAGTSFDGEELQALIRLPFNHVGSPTQNKRFAKAVLEIDCSPTAAIGVVPEFSYGNPDQPPSQELSFSVSGGGGFWDSANWNQLYWSSPAAGLAEADLRGFGRNVSLAILSATRYESPHTIHGLTLHYAPRGLAR